AGDEADRQPEQRDDEEAHRPDGRPDDQRPGGHAALTEVAPGEDVLADLGAEDGDDRDGPHRPADRPARDDGPDDDGDADEDAPTGDHLDDRPDDPDDDGDEDERLAEHPHEVSARVPRWRCS